MKFISPESFQSIDNPGATWKISKETSSKLFNYSIIFSY